MIEFGCLARYFNDYRDEVRFAKDNGFSFMQIWYDNKGLNLKQVEELLPAILDEHDRNLLFSFSQKHAGNWLVNHDVAFKNMDY